MLKVLHFKPELDEFFLLFIQFLRRQSHYVDKIIIIKTTTKQQQQQQLSDTFAMTNYAHVVRKRILLQDFHFSPTVAGRAVRYREYK